MVHVVSWATPQRRIAGVEADDFFGSKLEEPWLFHYRTSKMEVPPHEAAFSLKLTLAREERYNFGRRAVPLRAGQILFTSSGRTYGSEVQRESECLSLFLPERWATALSSSLSPDPDSACSADSMAEPPAVPLRADAAVAAILFRLHRSLHDGAAVEDNVESLLAAAAACWARELPPTRASASRKATQEELLARCLRVRDAIRDNGGIGCSLDFLSETACLSRYHLIRVFADLFGCTPAAYARKVRIERASALLRRGSSLRNAARSAGYAFPHGLTRARKAHAAQPGAAGGRPLT